MSFLTLKSKREAQSRASHRRHSGTASQSNCCLLVIPHHSPLAVVCFRRIVVAIKRLAVAASLAEFHAGWSQRFGTANPERMDVPFWNAMVRSGSSAWRASSQFDCDFDDSNDVDDVARCPVWCHDRFGMTLTALPDGRRVQIAGEHEDYYEPNFCIYNDVVVHDGQGDFEIFGYPKDIFPPTDFHSATLVGEWIYLIGNLGYSEARGHETPVFRLHTGDWHIERVETRGESPGWIHGHQAELEDGRIRVSGGKRHVLSDAGEGKNCELEGSYTLDLASGTWQRV